MDITPFVIHYLYYGQMTEAEIRPCCKEENVVDYAVWMNGKLEFTITKVKDAPQGSQWTVALKNADNLVDQKLVQIMGAEIDKKNSGVELKS